MQFFSFQWTTIKYSSTIKYEYKQVKKCVANVTTHTLKKCD